MTSRSRDAASPRPGGGAEPAPVCVWMSAGVMCYWLCPRGFDCEGCVLDRILSGRDPVDPAPQAEGEGDTVLHDVEHGPLAALGVPLRRRRGLWYHPLHLWGRTMGPTRVRLGLDDVAARLLADAEPWSLPPVGSTLQDGRPLARTRVHGQAVQIASPLSGRVLARNDGLRRFPSLASWSPYDAGWLVELAVETPIGALGGFMRDDAVVSHWFERELHHLAACAPEASRGELGETLADGGAPCATLQQALGAEGLHAALRAIMPHAVPGP